MSKKDERLDNIIEELKDVSILKSHETKEMYQPFVYDIIMKLDMVYGEHNNRYNINYNDPEHITTRYVDNNRIFIYNTREKLIKESWQPVGEKIKEALLQLMDGKTNKLKKLFDENLLDIPKIYKEDISDWSIKNLGNDKEINIERKMIVHLTNIIVAMYLNGIKRKTKESVVRQLNEYIELGGIVTKPESTTTPEPYAAVNDGRDGLVWRYKKTCPNCDSMLSSCFCSDIMYYPTSDDFVSEHMCGECYNEAAIRYLMKDYNEKFTEQQCEYMMEGVLDYFKEEAERMLKEKNRLILPYNLYYNVVDFDKCLLGTMTVTNREHAKKLLHIVFTEFYDDGGGDPPEDMCSCQGF